MGRVLEKGLDFREKVIMKKEAKRSSQRRLHVVCPFCSALVDYRTALTWCSSCYVEFKRKDDGKVIFDDKLKTERFALAKAVMKSGGMKIGDSSERQ